MKQSQPHRIIHRQEHPISRAMISPNVLKILYRLKDNGHVAYLVGGGVRDLLLGREPKDFDVATDATPGQIKKLFRNCRLVGRRFRLAHLHFTNEIVEVSTFRGSIIEGLEENTAAALPGHEDVRQPRHLVSDDGLVLRDNVFGSPSDDAKRRDFTVNALAYNIADFSILDYVGGMEDLEIGVIRTIGDPATRFVEDPVRMLRAVRFAALLGFTVEGKTWQALVENAQGITRATPPRLYEEVLKLFLSGEAAATYQHLRLGGLFSPLFPGFDEWLTGETECFPHTRLGKNLEWIDTCIAAGGSVSAPLMLALMFGEYLEEQAIFYRKQGVSPQDAIDAAVADFMAEQAPLVAIPHRVALAVREIMVLQNRFRKIPGKRPQSVLARPAFMDALTYLRCCCESTGEGSDVATWWEKYAENRVLPQVAAKKEKDGDHRRPRRRKRRGRVAAPSV
ncbi:MAG: polynucleotide adenylyltransferase PcnB [Deltaproteobacteria bacterium]|nr:polynucleotide adenylyltransferase PcnB [Deltaproteobacteria bacterium]